MPIPRNPNRTPSQRNDLNQRGGNRRPAFFFSAIDLAHASASAASARRHSGIIHQDTDDHGGEWRRG